MECVMFVLAEARVVRKQQIFFFCSLLNRYIYVCIHIVWLLVGGRKVANLDKKCVNVLGPRKEMVIFVIAEERRRNGASS
jgi:hypothetical protein